MEIERTLHEAFAMREPPGDFEEVVMARVSAAAWRGEQRKNRGSNRVVLIVAALAVACSAAVLMALRTGVALRTGAGPRQLAEVPPAMTVGSQPALEVSAFQPDALPPPASRPGNLPLDCDAPQAMTAPKAFSVLIAPLRDEANTALDSNLREYYDALLRALRRIPGLALIEAEAAAAETADFRITVTGLRNAPAGAPSSADRWVVLQVDEWTGGSFGKSRQTFRRSIPQSNDRSPAELPALDVGLLQLPRRPNAGMKECERAVDQRIAQQTPERPAAADFSLLREMIERLAHQSPTARISMLGILANQLQPASVPALLDGLRSSTDDGIRDEVVSLLAVKFPDDPAVRQAMATVAAGDPDSWRGHIAVRVVAGDAPWRDFTMDRVRNASLPMAQRLQPLYWMVEAMTLEPKTASSLADVLAALQQGGGIPSLADLLVATQRQTADPVDATTVQQGWMAMRKLGSLDHPAAAELLMACFDAMPTETVLTALAARRNDARVLSKLESIAADRTNISLARRAAVLLNEAPNNASRPVGLPSGQGAFMPSGDHGPPR